MNRLRSLSLLAALGGAALLFSRACAAETEDIVKFSDPSKPGTVRIALVQGSLQIEAADSPGVVVHARNKPPPPARKDGMRVLTDSSSCRVTEKDNVITVDAASDGWAGAPADVQITVPRQANVVVANSLGGDISCRGGLTGDIEIKTMHGEIHLADLSGGALVETMNGELTASFRELRGKPVSLTSINGQVTVRIPESTKANVRLRTQNGSILTDFDDKALVTKMEVLPGGRLHHAGSLTPQARNAFREAARAGAIAAKQAADAIREATEAARAGVEEEVDNAPPAPPAPPTPPVLPTVTGGKLITGTLNGGGPEISIATMNGDITLQKLSGHAPAN